GAIPQDLKYAGEPTRLVIGNANQIREFSTVHIGTAAGGGVTRLGNRCLLMANSHVAHDVQLGDGCVLANSTALAGHVVVEDHVIFGGLSAVHQFTRIGRLAFVSGGAMVTQDVPPYVTVQGDRAEVVGLNTVGLTRAHFDEHALTRVKGAYKIVFRSKMGLREAVAHVKPSSAAIRRSTISSPSSKAPSGASRGDQDADRAHRRIGAPACPVRGSGGARRP